MTDDARGSVDVTDSLPPTFRAYEQRIWTRLKRAFKREAATHDDRPWMGRGKAHMRTRRVALDDWTILLETASDALGGTRLRAAVNNPDRLRFRVYDGGLIDEAKKLAFGMQDIVIGDYYFDDDYIIQGAPLRRVHRLFDNATLRKRMLAHGSFDLQLRPMRGQLPTGIDELILSTDSVGHDVGLLSDAYRLFAAALNQITHDGSAYGEDMHVHASRLKTPGQRVYDGNLLIYDGWKVRVDAARKLASAPGRQAVPALSNALDVGPPAVRARAAESLGVIGDPRAITALIGQLWNPSEYWGKSVSAWCGKALKRLGEGDLAAAVRSALRGHRNGLPERVAHRRRPVVDTFIEALGTEASIHAVRALAELHAREALPQLRSLARIAGLRSPKGQAVMDAIQALEGQASLPRPVAAPADEGRTLPRPATGEAPAGDLPRSVPVDEEDRGP